MSDPTKYNIETREVTKKKTFVTINNKELDIVKVLSFIEELDGTDGFTSVRWCHKYSSIAEPMVEEGLVKKNVKGSWYAGDNEKLEELKSLLREAYYY